MSPKLLTLFCLMSSFAVSNCQFPEEDSFIHFKDRNLESGGDIEVGPVVKSDIADVEDNLVETDPSYSYSFNVADDQEQLYQSQTQERSNNVVKGQYSWVDQEGTKHVVVYRADETGYHIIQMREEKNFVRIQPKTRKLRKNGSRRTKLGSRVKNAFGAGKDDKGRDERIINFVNPHPDDASHDRTFALPETEKSQPPPVFSPTISNEPSPINVLNSIIRNSEEKARQAPAIQVEDFETAPSVRVAAPNHDARRILNAIPLETNIGSSVPDQYEDIFITSSTTIRPDVPLFVRNFKHRPSPTPFQEGVFSSPSPTEDVPTENNLPSPLSFHQPLAEDRNVEQRSKARRILNSVPQKSGLRDAVSVPNFISVSTTARPQAVFKGSIRKPIRPFTIQRQFRNRARRPSSSASSQTQSIPVLRNIPPTAGTSANGNDSELIGIREEKGELSPEETTSFPPLENEAFQDGQGVPKDDSEDNEKDREDRVFAEIKKDIFDILSGGESQRVAKPTFESEAVGFSGDPESITTASDSLHETTLAQKRTSTAPPETLAQPEKDSGLKKELLPSSKGRRNPFFRRFRSRLAPRNEATLETTTSPLVRVVKRLRKKNNNASEQVDQDGSPHVEDDLHTVSDGSTVTEPITDKV